MPAKGQFKRLSADGLSKTCARCLVEMPLAGFSVDAGCAGGRCSICRQCMSEYHKRRSRSDLAYQSGIRRRRLAYANHARDAFLRRSYGITLVDYSEMLKAQGGLCGICKRSESHKSNGRPRALSVDHCHNTGVVRGLLCRSCNSAIGRVGDCVLRASTALVYLHEPPVMIPMPDTCGSLRGRWAKYGIAPSDFRRISETQGGKCRICEASSARRLTVDHDHKTGAIRGLLCGPCNQFLGFMRDDNFSIARLLFYLSSAERKVVAA